MTLEEMGQSVETAKQEYYRLAQEHHKACWENLQALLPDLTALVLERYPGATIECEETEWTSQGEHYFDHWVRIYAASEVTWENEGDFYEECASLFPPLPSCSIGLYSASER